MHRGRAERVEPGRLRPDVPSVWLREALHDTWPRPRVVGAPGRRTSSSPAWTLRQRPSAKKIEDLRELDASIVSGTALPSDRQCECPRQSELAERTSAAPDHPTTARHRPRPRPRRINEPKRRGYSMSSKALGTSTGFGGWRGTASERYHAMSRRGQVARIWTW
jgi:hypothetical protein